MAVIGDLDVHEPNLVRRAVDRHARDQTASFIARVVDGLEHASPAYDFGGGREATLLEGAFEGAALLAVTVRIDQNVLDQQVELGLRPPWRHDANVDRNVVRRAAEPAGATPCWSFRSLSPSAHEWGGEVVHALVELRRGSHRRAGMCSVEPSSDLPSCDGPEQGPRGLVCETAREPS